MTLEVPPLSPALGAEIRGVDLSRAQEPAVVEGIRAAWDRYAVLLFRDQRLEIDDQRRFVRYLGEVQPSRTPAERKHPDITYVGNVTVDGQAGEIPYGEMQFHADHCYFAGTAAAYDALPPELRRELVGYDRARSEALIEELCGYVERPEHIYEHVWRPNDLLLWDNLATAHARTDFDPAERRALRRMAIRGDRPRAYRELTRATV